MKKIKTTIAMIVFTLGICLVALVFAAIWLVGHLGRQLTAKAVAQGRSVDRPVIMHHEP